MDECYEDVFSEINLFEKDDLYTQHRRTTEMIFDIWEEDRNSSDCDGKKEIEEQNMEEENTLEEDQLRLLQQFEDLCKSVKTWSSNERAKGGGGGRRRSRRRRRGLRKNHQEKKGLNFLTSEIQFIDSSEYEPEYHQSKKEIAPLANPLKTATLILEDVIEKTRRDDEWFKNFQKKHQFN